MSVGSHLCTGITLAGGRETTELGLDLACFFATNPPGMTKVFTLLVDLSLPSNQVVVLKTIVVATETTHLVLVFAADRDLEVAVSVPNDLQSDVSPKGHAMAVFPNGELVSICIGKGDPLPVNFDHKVLKKTDTCVAHDHDQHLGPSKPGGQTDTILDFNGEGIFFGTVFGEEVFACSLEVEHLAVEGSVVRITEYSTHSVFCKI